MRPIHFFYLATSLVFLSVLAQAQEPTWAKVSGQLPKSANEFCSNYEGAGKSDGHSLQWLAKGLNLNSLGSYAVNANKTLKMNGFIDLLESQPNLMTDLKNIPEGAVFVLDGNKDASCKVNPQFGHVVVNCPSKNSGLQAHLRKCVKAVMMKPEWEVLRKSASQIKVKANSAK